MDIDQCVPTGKSPNTRILFGYTVPPESIQDLILFSLFRYQTNVYYSGFSYAPFEMTLYRKRIK